MPTLKLTKTEISKIPAPHPSGRQVLFWDTELKGFGVLVSGTTASKSFVVQHKLANGNSRRLTVGACNVFELAAAKEEAKKLLAKLYLNVDPKAEKRAADQRDVTLRAALHAYLQHRKNLSANSRLLYRGHCERHLKAWLDLPLRSITGDMVRRRHTEIGAAAEATANCVIRAFRMIYGFIEEQPGAGLPPNPAKAMSRGWYEVAPRTGCLKKEEYAPFYRAVGSLENSLASAAICLILFSGMRRNEAVGLRWSEVDFNDRVIRLPGERTKAGHGLELPMSDFIRDLLVARRAIGVDGDFVFPGDGAKGHLATLAEHLRRVAESTGILMTSHDLRRSFVTVGEEVEVSWLALKRMVGHSAGRDMTARYSQLTVERLREPVQRVCDRLKELCGIEQDSEIKKLA